MNAPVALVAVATPSAPISCYSSAASWPRLLSPGYLARCRPLGLAWSWTHCLPECAVAVRQYFGVVNAMTGISSRSGALAWC